MSALASLPTSPPMVLVSLNRCADLLGRLAVRQWMCEPPLTS